MILLKTLLNNKDRPKYLCRTQQEIEDQKIYIESTITSSEAVVDGANPQCSIMSYL
jgi:hypothetical protein